jgi:hypothetical protein
MARVGAGKWSRWGRFHPLRVLVGAAAFFVVAVLAYVVSPWVLPARILEGPMLQRTTPTAVSVVWYTSRPAECALALKVDDAERSTPAVQQGRRCHVRLTGLEPGSSYAYRISCGKRTLAEATLRTAKPLGSVFRFLVFGDSGAGSRAQYLLADQMLLAAPDFLLHTGDLIHSGGERYRFDDRFFAPYRELLKQVCFWPCLGNHDVSEPHLGAPYLEVFELPENGPAEVPPERNYWFDYASARVAVIDSNLDEATLRDAVAPWLTEVLSETGPRWRFVSLHHPPYTGGAYKPDKRIQGALVPVFEAVGVDIVFAGHDHMYQRTSPLRGGEIVKLGAGVVYVVSGAGGARLYEPLPPEQRPDYVAALNNRVHSLTRIDIDGETLRLRQIAVNGEIIDDWTMRKEVPEPGAS